MFQFHIYFLSYNIKFGDWSPADEGLKFEVSTNKT